MVETYTSCTYLLYPIILLMILYVRKFHQVKRMMLVCGNELCI
ncbi:MAG: hypothetical protein PUF50_06300 [Erysipelotrichaceae bacterium]|nr:hypothetical protein [Erysipelotrichaceae bacterium]